MENQYQIPGSRNPYLNMRNTAPLPNVTTALVLAILSLFLCCCYGLPGLISSIVALFLANGALKMSRMYPDQYRLKDVSNAGVARIIAIIGIVWSSLGTLYFVSSLILTFIDPHMARQQRKMWENLFN